MSLRIVRHRKAKRDLLQAYVFIGEDNLDAAERLLRAVNDDLRRLADMPGLGPVRESDNPKLAALRFLPVTGFRKYLLFYRATSTTLELVRVIHGARDIDAALDE
jgi:toxin ParE1/3/4